MCAPTGIAATHVNGTTIHSATGIGVPKCQEDFRRMHQGFRKELWTKLVEVLIIDEISMLSGEWLDNLERMLRELTHYYGRGEFQQYLRMPMKDIPASRRCVEINQCVACHHRAGVASMAWRSTRRFSTIKF